MSEWQFRLAKAQDREALLAFVHTHWDAADPFLDQAAFFSYYFEEDDGGLRFALAEDEGGICALAGYVPASRRKAPDIWISFWLADKTKRGVGLELMAQIPTLTGCTCMSCNNIRPKTRVFYEFLGYSTGRVGHFYRLAPQEKYHLARVQNPEILPVSGSYTLRLIEDIEALQACGFEMPKANPYKDFWHIQRRYFSYFDQKYRVYTAENEDEKPLALLILRVIETDASRVMRVVDFVGEAEILPKLGYAIDRLLKDSKAEYADFYCAGIDSELLKQAGFCERKEGDARNILPNYLEPPLFENTEYYYFTSEPSQFRLCKADGDQDRPRWANHVDL